MLIHLLVYVTAVIHAFPHKVRDDLFSQNSMEDFSAPFDPAGINIFDDGTLVSSAALLNDDSKDDVFLSPMNTDSSDALDFW